MESWQIRRMTDNVASARLLVAVVDDNVDSVERMLGAGVELDVEGRTLRKPYVDPLLHYACLEAGADVARFLLDRGAGHVNARNAKGEAALHVACASGNREAAVLLLFRGADVNLLSQFETTPLSLAADKGDFWLARLLVARGADTRCGIPGPLWRAVSRKELTPGHVAVARLLLEKGAEINESYFSEAAETALRGACRWGFLDAVRFLLTEGATVEPAGTKPLLAPLPDVDAETRAATKHS